MLDLTLVHYIDLVEVPFWILLVVYHWLVASCRSQPRRLSSTKTLPTPSSPCF